jgi:hypothetical protein
MTKAITVNWYKTIEARGVESAKGKAIERAIKDAAHNGLSSFSIKVLDNGQDEYKEFYFGKVLLYTA